MPTDRASLRAGRSAWLLTLALAGTPMAAESPVPEPLEPAARMDAQPGLAAEETADSGWPLDETVFTDIEAFTVPAVPVALPEDQDEE